MIALRTLASLLTYVIGMCGMLPLLPWLTPFPRIILVAGLIAGVWQDRRGTWPLKPWMQNSAIVPVFFYYASQFSRANPIQPVVSVLAIMLAVRLGGEKTVRHSLQIYVLATFCLASSSLFDLSPVFLVFLFLLLFLVAIALVLLTYQNQDPATTVSLPDLKRILCSALLMPVLAVPLLLIIFPLLPRTQMPLWHFLSPPSSRTTGYSDTVEPGSQSTVTESRTLAFRAEMLRQGQSRLYWRGTVFNRTDGNKWTRIRQIPTEQTAVPGQTVKQTIYPEPSATTALIALDRPFALDMRRATQAPDGVFELSRATGQRLSYGAESQLNGVIGQQNPVNRRFYLQLPDQLPARVESLASEIARSGVTDRARVEALERYFRNGGYRYTTRDLATGNRAVEQFLFAKKQGHCEFFASSFALLLRAAGVPCRLVGGYLGGDYNELGGYYRVTDDMAHVWVEAYIEGSGWVRIDPSGFAVNAEQVWTATSSQSLARHITLLLDSFNYAWNRSVISYDFEQQVRIARHVGSRLDGINLANMLRISAPYAAVVGFCAAVLFAAGRVSLFRSREERILRRFLETVEREFNISPNENGEGLFEIAVAAGNSHVSDFVTIYGGAVYHDRKLTEEEYVQLKQILRRLKRMKSKTT